MSSSPPAGSSKGVGGDTELQLKRAWEETGICAIGETCALSVDAALEIKAGLQELNTEPAEPFHP